jgi:hypothetical protein
MLFHFTVVWTLLKKNQKTVFLSLPLLIQLITIKMLLTLLQAAQVDVVQENAVMTTKELIKNVGKESVVKKK